MRISDALMGITRLGVETSPFIYFTEQNTTYFTRAAAIFRKMSSGEIFCITSVITLTEVLTKPIKEADYATQQAYELMLLTTRNLLVAPIDVAIAERAAELRARYNLKTPDALQVATAIVMGCDALLTNDLKLKQISELHILILDELQLDSP